MEVVLRRELVGSVEAAWRQAGDAPVLYVHGVPNSSSQWLPFLERGGGVAVDLPGFGASAKPGDFDYSIAGYDRFLEGFLDTLGLERVSLVVHDWGGVALALAQRRPERIERLVMFGTVPLLPGYRWHRVARLWRTPGVGELAMGATTRWALRREMPRELADAAWEDFDHGTQRAILRLYRSAPPDVLAAAGADLARVTAPALVLWPEDDPYIGPEFGPAYARALGGPVELDTIAAGHWAWAERPELVARTLEFLG